MLNAVLVSVIMVTVVASLMLTSASPFTFRSSLWKRVRDGKMLGARYHKVENQEVVLAKFLSLSSAVCQFFTDMLLFIYIQSTMNIYLFIGIRIRCQ